MILRKKNELWKKITFFTFFPILMILWLCEPLRDEKLKIIGSHGRKCKLGQYINQIRAFQMICWYFDFCGLGRFCQIWPKVRPSETLSSKSREINIFEQISDREGSPKKAALAVPKKVARCCWWWWRLPNWGGQDQQGRSRAGAKQERGWSMSRAGTGQDQGRSRAEQSKVEQGNKRAGAWQELVGS